MHELVEDPGYASLLGAFGPALLDPTGSRPPLRQSDGITGPTVIKHPRELRAILNNAILQQLGWCANTLQGIGAAAARQPELFLELREKSPRFRRALDFVSRALSHSDIDVLRAGIALLDPGSWLDRAAHVEPARAQQLVGVANALNQLDLWAPVQAMFRRIQTDYVQLRAAWPDAPEMQTREMLLHALRIALIQRIWLMATAIPDFSPRHGVTRQALEMRLLQLDVLPALALLGRSVPERGRSDRRARFRRAARSARRGVLCQGARTDLRTDRPPVRAGARDQHRDHARERGVRVESVSRTACASASRIRDPAHERGAAAQ